MTFIFKVSIKKTLLKIYMFKKIYFFAPLAQFRFLNFRNHVVADITT